MGGGLQMNERILEDRVSHAALSRYFQGTYKTVLTNIIVPLIVVAVMWTQIEPGLLIGWALLMSAGILVKHFQSAAFLRREVPAADANTWGRRAAYPVFFLGSLWAIAMFAFYVEGSAPHIIFLVSIMATLAAMSVISGIYWFPLYYLYSVPIMAALVIRLAMEAEFPYIALAALLSLGYMGIFSIARRLNEAVRSEMRLRQETVELSRALRMKSEEAEQAVMAKFRVMAAASHDLRQPLHALSLLIDVLRESESEVERKEIFPRIELSLNALRKLFDSLLDMSRLDAKAVKPEYSHFDIAGMLGRLADEFEPKARQRGLQLRVRANQGIVVSDPLLLERILRNLIGNALRYTDSGSVLVAARPRKQDFLIQVWDTGVGIPRESHDKVFDEFQQLHNPHRNREEGIGLGLAIVKRLCQLLGYPLELRSEPGKGSVFSIRVPRGNAALAARQDDVMPEHGWDPRGGRVLVIDDELDILRAMDALLSKWGLEVVTAETLAEGLDKLREAGQAPDLILSDLRLRDSASGIDAIDTLRKVFGTNVPGILITGDTAPGQIRLAADSGYQLLQKPVRPIQLRSVIQQYLAAARY